MWFELLDKEENVDPLECRGAKENNIIPFLGGTIMGELEGKNTINGKQIEAVTKAIMFSAKTELPDAFKDDIAGQLDQLFEEPGKLNNVTINEFASISSNHLVGQQKYQKTLDARVKQLVSNSDEELISGLTELRNAAESIMPTSKFKALQPGGIANRCLKFVGFNYDKKKIAKAVTRFDGAQTTISKICENLNGAKDVIKEDLRVLLEVGDELASNQFNVVRDIYFIETLVNKIVSAGEIPGINEDAKESLLLSLRQDLLDLKALEHVNAQYLITIEQTCLGARMKVKSVERACGLTGKTASIGLLLKGVMDNNRRITNAIDASREFISAQIEHNAESFAEQTDDLERQASQTFVGIESLQKSYGVIYDALEKSSGGLGRANEKIQQALTQLDGIKLPDPSKRLANNSRSALTLGPGVSVASGAGFSKIDAPTNSSSAGEGLGFLRNLTKEAAEERR
jgi:uncharacterized protein YaaN involved in tellurite resistance